MVEYIAHVRKGDMERQFLKDHLLGVSDIAAQNASKIGLANIGEILGLLHDLGKYSQQFQNYICSGSGLLNPDEEDYLEYKEFKGKIDHSTAGAQLIWEKLKVIGRNGQGELCAQILCLCIVSHHSGLIDCLSEDGESKYFKRIEKTLDKTYLNECLKNVDEYIENKINEILTAKLVKSLFHRIQSMGIFSSNVNLELTKVDSFTLGFLTRFLFSCVVDADRLDSAEFEDPIRKKVRINRGKWFNWSTAIDRLKQKLNIFDTDGPVNHIRQEISDICKNRAKDKQGIYSLTVPTGGGKTLASLRYSLIHAKKYNLERIIYVIPYTSIIEQNAEEIRKILDDESDKYSWVLENHSNLEPEKQTWHTKLAAENWDAPIVFTTMVQFLEVLFSGGTSRVRRMHQLARSVIIFDEIQTLPINCTHLFCNALNFFTKYANSTAILCTATQPLLDQLRSPEYGQLHMAENSGIIPDPYKLFLDLERVQINNCIKTGGWSEDEIITKALELYNKKGSCLVIVNTKDWAKRLFIGCEKEIGADDVFHLSTSQYPAHRKKKLKKIRARLDNKEPVLCVSTQLIEAGVDIDFSSVIRFQAGLDSIAQAAGRCNRNGKLHDANGNLIKGQVFILNPDKENVQTLVDIDKGQNHLSRILDEIPSTDLLSPKTMKQYFKYYFFDRSVEMTYEISGKKCLRDDNLMNILSTNPLNTAGDSRLVSKSRLCRGKIPLLRQSFMYAGKVFQAIDAPTHAVIIEHDEGKALIGELCSLAKEFRVEEYYKALKRAQMFSVNVFPNIWRKLVDEGAVFETQKGEGIYYLSSDYYSEDFGLSTESIGSAASTIY